jgi:hypothetical protein
MAETINAYKLLVGKPHGKRPFGKPRSAWKDNIKIDIRELGCEYINGIT